MSDYQILQELKEINNNLQTIAEGLRVIVGHLIEIESQVEDMR